MTDLEKRARDWKASKGYIGWTDAMVCEFRTAEVVRETKELRADAEMLHKGCIVEIAVVNQSVADYVSHWEGRTLKAEARVAELERLSWKILAEAWYVLSGGDDPAERCQECGCAGYGMLRDALHEFENKFGPRPFERAARLSSWGEGREIIVIGDFGLIFVVGTDAVVVVWLLERIAKALEKIAEKGASDGRK